jgi:hypothetical protein
VEARGTRRHHHEGGGHLDAHSSSSSDGSDRDDDNDSLDEEEREREDALSRRYGEAAEARGGSSKNKRSSDDDQVDIDALYEKKKRKSARAPDLITVETLTGPEGLVKIPNDLRMELSRLQPPAVGKKSLVTSAQYALTLVESYRSYFFQLAPNLAFEDALLKVERLGSKRPVRKYLEQMRQNARNAHVEAVLGKERADRVLRELHDALEQQEQQLEGMNEFNTGDAGAGAISSEPPTESMAKASDPLVGGSAVDVAAPSQQRQSLGCTTSLNDDEEEEKEATFDEGAPAGGTAPFSSAAEPDRADDVVASLFIRRRTLTRRASGRRVLDDSDDDNDEEELGRDHALEDRNTSLTSSAAATGAAAKRRRFVLDYDDDDDDNGDGDNSGNEIDIDGEGSSSSPGKASGSPLVPCNQQETDIVSLPGPTSNFDENLESPVRGDVLGPKLTDKYSPSEMTIQNKKKESGNDYLGLTNKDQYEETEYPSQQDRFSLPLAQTLSSSERTSQSSSESASPSPPNASPPATTAKVSNPTVKDACGPVDDDNDSIDVSDKDDEYNETPTVAATMVMGLTELADGKLGSMDSEKDGFNDEDDETATVIPTLLTGPTQLAGGDEMSNKNSGDEDGVRDKEDDYETATVIPTLLTGPTQLLMDKEMLHGDHDHDHDHGGN